MGTITLLMKWVRYEMGKITILMKWYDIHFFGYEMGGSCYEMGKMALVSYEMGTIMGKMALVIAI